MTSRRRLLVTRYLANIDEQRSVVLVYVRILYSIPSIIERLQAHAANRQLYEYVRTYVYV